MRAFIITLATLFALALAWSPSSDIVNADDHAEISHYSDLQFFVSSSNSHTSHTNLPPGPPEKLFEEVSLPTSRNYVLGSPKFPVNIIAGIEKEYCSMNLTQFDSLCAKDCHDSNACFAYFIFEATNSGTPKLPWWFCYLVDTYVDTDDFVYDVNANFAHAYIAVFIP